MINPEIIQQIVDDTKRNCGPTVFPWGESGDPLWEAREAGWGNEIIAAYVLGLQRESGYNYKYFGGTAELKHRPANLPICPQCGPINPVVVFPILPGIDEESPGRGPFQCRRCKWEGYVE